MTKHLMVGLLLSRLAAISGAQESALPKGTECGKSIPNKFWTESFERTRSRYNDHEAKQFSNKRAKNVIIFVGDGLGISTMTAGRIHVGRNKRESLERVTCGAEYEMFFERNLPMTGLSKTYSINKQTPDSASTATAMFSGIKTEHYNLGHPDDEIKRESIMEYAKSLGKTTGFITTTHLFHATPAALYAHHSVRWEYGEVARQFTEKINMFDVALGGGNGISQIMKTGGYENFKNTQNYTDVTPENIRNPSGCHGPTPYIGTFSAKEMPFIDEREEAKHPNLTEMTLFTLDKLTELDKNNAGFFMMSEGGRIDQAHHMNYAKRALEELRELDETIEATYKKLEKLGILDETLIILTADHSHQFVMGSYSNTGESLFTFLPEDIRKNDWTRAIEHNGKIFNENHSFDEIKNINEQYMPISYVTGPGRHWHSLNESDASDFEAADFQFPSFVRTRSATHAGEDVAIFARGPQSQLVSGSHEQSDIYYIMKEAFDYKVKPQPPTETLAKNSNKPKNWVYGVHVVYGLLIIVLTVICLKQKNALKEYEEANIFLQKDDRLIKSPEKDHEACAV